MIESVLFLVGLCLGLGIAHYRLNKVNSILSDLNQKHTRLIDILQTWQKKI